MSNAPHSLYIRYLATQGILDYKNVNIELENLGLHPVDAKIVDTQQKQIMDLLPEVTTKKLKSKRKSKDWMTWMKILDVHEMWYTQPQYKDHSAIKGNAALAAKDILHDRKLVVSISALLMKKMDISAITQSMNIRFQLDLTDLIVATFRKYFFNPMIMARSHWKEFLRECNEWEQHVYFTALTDSLDAVKFEIGLPASVNVTDELGFLLRKSFQKSKQHLRGNTLASAAEARRWIGVSLSLADKYEKYRDADTTDFGNALEMELIHDSDNFADASDILGQGGPETDPDTVQDDTDDGLDDSQLALPDMDST